MRSEGRGLRSLGQPATSDRFPGPGVSRHHCVVLVTATIGRCSRIRSARSAAAILLSQLQSPSWGSLDLQRVEVVASTRRNEPMDSSTQAETPPTTDSQRASDMHALRQLTARYEQLAWCTSAKDQRERAFVDETAMKL